jgi:hypothetical protein
VYALATIGSKSTSQPGLNIIHPKHDNTNININIVLLITLSRQVVKVNIIFRLQVGQSANTLTLTGGSKSKS